MTVYTFPFILFKSNLCQSASRQTVSKAFSKSINAQYNFLLLFLNNSIKLYNKKHDQWLNAFF